MPHIASYFFLKNAINTTVHDELTSLCRLLLGEATPLQWPGRKAQTSLKPLIHGKYTILIYIHPHWGLLCTYRGQKATILSWEKISLVEKILNAPGHPRDVQSTTRPPGWMDNTDIMNFRPFSSLSWTDKPSTNAWWEKLTLYFWSTYGIFQLTLAALSSFKPQGWHL